MVDDALILISAFLKLLIVMDLQGKADDERCFMMVGDSLMSDAWSWLVQVQV